MTEVWGLLAKTQTDPQTIDEAIDAKVAAHEADPDSHLGTDESLQSHKAAVILDHLIGSVVTDKLTMTEYRVHSIFDSLVGYNLTGNVQNDYWFGMTLWSDYSPANPARAVSKDSIVPDFIDYSKNILFQVTAQIVETTNKKVFFGFGFLSAGDVVNGIGFKIVNSTLYGYSYASGALVTATLSGVTLTDTNVYRAQWDKDLGQVTFFVNGVEKGSIANASPTGGGDGDVLFSIEATASGECQLNVFDFYASRDI